MGSACVTLSFIKSIHGQDGGHRLCPTAAYWLRHPQTLLGRGAVAYPRSNRGTGTDSGRNVARNVAPWGMAQLSYTWLESHTRTDNLYCLFRIANLPSGGARLRCFKRKPSRARFLCKECKISPSVQNTSIFCSSTSLILELLQMWVLFSLLSTAHCDTQFLQYPCLQNRNSTTFCGANNWLSHLSINSTSSHDTVSDKSAGKSRIAQLLTRLRIPTWICSM